uniref:tyrosine-type recombinase/integrase n=1 Tax=Pediococcus claussenii TaxID=187452 RepID=UPI001E56FACB|nr:tyrosine-type recombinase/integrase [Pediococcus claussenii]
MREALAECYIDKPSFHFHSLRHTHVAYLLSEGVDLYVISKRLGHSGISTTSRVYSYLIDEYQQKSDLYIEKSLDKT